jgi:hypothetical protein
VVGLTMLRLLTDLGLGENAATNAYLLTLTALSLLWLSAVLIASVSAEQPPRHHPKRPAQERSARLVDLEEAVEWSMDSAHVRDIRLRPDVRAAVADRLVRWHLHLGEDLAAAIMGPTTRWLVESQSEAEPGTVRGLDGTQVRDLTAELATLDERLQTSNIVAKNGEQHGWSSGRSPRSAVRSWTRSSAR